MLLVNKFENSRIAVAVLCFVPHQDKAKGLKGVSDEDFSIQLGYLQSYKEKFCRGDAVRVMMQMLVDTAEPTPATHAFLKCLKVGEQLYHSARKFWS